MNSTGAKLKSNGTKPKSNGDMKRELLEARASQQAIYNIQKEVHAQKQREKDQKKILEKLARYKGIGELGHKLCDSSNSSKDKIQSMSVARKIQQQKVKEENQEDEGILEMFRELSLEEEIQLLEEFSIKKGKTKKCLKESSTSSINKLLESKQKPSFAADKRIPCPSSGVDAYEKHSHASLETNDLRKTPMKSNFQKELNNLNKLGGKENSSLEQQNFGSQFHIDTKNTSEQKLLNVHSSFETNVQVSVKKPTDLLQNQIDTNINNVQRTFEQMVKTENVKIIESPNNSDAEIKNKLGGNKNVQHVRGHHPLLDRLAIQSPSLKE